MSVTTLDQGRFVEVNDRFLSLFGYAPADLVGRAVGDVGLWWDLRQRDEMVRRLARDGALRDWQVELRHRAGERRLAQLSAELIDLDAEPHVLAVTEDITERTRLADEVRVMRDQLLRGAFHDPLTSLPNRALLLDRMERALARRARHPERHVAVLMVDLDELKVVNDSLGMLAGDELLAAVGRRLHDLMRPEDTIARVGGDAFAVLLEDLVHLRDATQVAERVIRCFDECFELSGWQTFASASVGIAWAGSEGDAAQLLREADTAVHRAKTRGRGAVALYDVTMHEHALARFRLEGDLRHALARGEFELYYQPLVALPGGAVTGLEALLRWRHRERGLLMPARFVSVAEETGAIVPIGRWVLKQACRQLRRWQEQFGLPTLGLNLNVSARQLAAGSLVDSVRAAVGAARLEPGCVTVEITESTLIQEAAAAAETLDALRSFGVHVALDDFGTGYSPLTHLRRFPVDVLKIDRAFVSRTHADLMDREIVRAVVTLGRRMGMQVVAEGVESAEQARYLTGVACDHAQGFLYAPPVPAAQVPRLLQRGSLVS